MVAHQFSAAAAALLLLLAAPQYAHAASNITANSTLVHWAGRTLAGRDDGSIKFDWVGTSARVTLQGASYLRAGIRTEFALATDASRAFVYVTSQNWSPYGYPEANIWISQLQTEYVLATALPTGEKHIVTIANEVSPQYYDAEHSTNGITYLWFETDGTFEQSAPLPRKLEFIGDSITAATNVIAHPPCGDAGLQSAFHSSYSNLLALNFSAELSAVIAVGGKGLVRNCCDKSTTMPGYYMQPLFSSPPAYAFPSTSRPDAVVINLGTNDAAVGNFSDPAFAAEFTSAYVSLLTNITRYWDQAGSGPAIVFFAATGPMTKAPTAATTAAVASARAAGLSVFAIDMSAAPTDGCAGHPGVAGHAAMARAAQPVIAQAMGW